MRTGGSWRLLLAMAALAAPGCIAHAAGQEKSLLDACWSPAEIAAKPGENRSVRPDRRFDAAPGPAPLAPFEPQTVQGVVRRVDVAGDRKLIALTFDLCEQLGEVAGYDGGVIDYLRKERVKATFFAGGKWMRSHEERVRQLMADPLFELGNHAEAHRNLRRLEGARLADEIAGPQRTYEEIRARFAETQCTRSVPQRLDAIAPRLSLFRFPYGACNPRALQAVADQGLTAIQWDLSSGDPWPAQSAKAIARLLLARARPGSIILAHANGKGWHTAAALPLVIPKLREMGYEFVTVSELIAAGKPVVSATCYDSHPGDTDRWDHPELVRQQTARQQKQEPQWPKLFPW